MTPFLNAAGLAGLPAVLMLAACNTGPAQGTAVGNPTVLAMQLSDGDGVDFGSATGSATLVRLTNPDDVSVLTTGRTLDLISDDSLTAKPGDWTALTLEFDGGVTLEAGGVERTLPVDALSVVGEFSTAEPLVLLLGGAHWLDRRAWEEAGVEELADELIWGTALYSDNDADGTLDEYEEAAGEVACSRCEVPATSSGSGSETTESTATHGHHGDDSRRAAQDHS